MNFNGSFSREERKDGYGGVVRNNYGRILCTLSEPVECDDANGAVVFAMLMGCHGLHQVEVISAIVEGNSFSSIQ